MTAPPTTMETARRGATTASPPAADRPRRQDAAHEAPAAARPMPQDSTPQGAAHQAPRTARPTRPGEPRALPAGTLAAGALTAAVDDVPRVLERCRALVRPALEEAVGRLHPWVGEMAAYSFGWCEVGGAPAVASGGKGVRQALAVLGAEAAGAPERAGVAAAVAVELVHTFSLLHDDIMDGDGDRRGRPTVWKAYGTGPAVLAGDALFALAVETLAAEPGGAGAVRTLSVALRDLVGGQADDLLLADRPWTGPERARPDEYRAMAEHKTGALLGCAAALGAVLGGAGPETVAALDRAGRHLGVAFQIVDDVLGIWGDPRVTGKPVHGDLREGKKTFPVLVALGSPMGGRIAGLLASGDAPETAATLIEKAGGRSAALAEARRHITAVETALAEVPSTARAADDLRSLLGYLVRREV
ncbi:polyprenyl synthetase family protein [Streptomyces massasporeus]|uniref:polyprenyl synthetase family protein n=1 Tax=Streptomyces massasporeus TaxID=67324 RepID=UPI003675CD61